MARQENPKKSAPRAIQFSDDQSGSMTAEESALAIEPEGSSAKGRSNAGGPRTKTGRQSSSRNSIKHGIFADILLSEHEMGEASEEYLRLLSALRGAIRSRDSFVDIQVESLAFWYLRLARIFKADLRVTPKLFKKMEEILDAGGNALEFDMFNLGTQAAVNRKDPSPELIIRYEANTLRQISRAMGLLQQWLTICPNDPKLLKAVPGTDEGRMGKGLAIQPLVAETPAHDVDNSSTG